MKIYQIEPTIVFESGDCVIKAFAQLPDCEAEKAVLARARDPLLATGPEGERLEIIGVVWQKGAVLALQKAAGSSLEQNTKEQKAAISMAARFLAGRHRPMLAETHATGNMLGDFVIDHLFWEQDTGRMILIDPGTNFLVEGDIIEDVARFLFSVAAKYRWRPWRAVSLIAVFWRAYKFDHPELRELTEAALKTRLAKSWQKCRLQKSFHRATAAQILLLAHYALIRLRFAFMS